MKKILFVSIFGVCLILPALASGALPLEGKVIALDAGHGGGEMGAIGYCNGVPVVEADVNVAVRTLLKAKIEAAGGIGYEVAQLASRSDRVADAEAQGADVLISIHHNGSSDVSVNYTKSFVTQKNDKEFASFIHPELVSALGLPDRGIKNDGYGMTVYGSLPGVLTEAFFITNTDEACDFLGARARVEAEAQALYDGLVAYFSRSTDGGNGGGTGRGKNK